ncbi:hypothetical protein [Trichothermofontia sp.]
MTGLYEWLGEKTHGDSHDLPPLLGGYRLARGANLCPESKP